MKQFIVPTLLALAAPLALAKLPPPDDAAKAKAAEAAARTAWQAKVENYLLCKSQDRVVAHYKKTAGSKPASAVSSQDAKPVATTASAAAAPAAAAPAAAAPTNPAPAAAPTPAAQVAAAPCVDPGPFAYTPPAEKPLEASGAHSPAGTAAGAPSVSAPAAQLQAPPQPAKKP
mgnify:CR=1 FL=1